jgi:carbonic anhydrase
MTTTDEFVTANQTYADSGFPGEQPLPPARKVAVVACMDARLDPAKVFGFGEGDAHVIRNAGGAVTADVERSLAISQRLLGTEEIVLVHHTDCGMLTFADDDFRSGIEKETGLRPTWAAEAFADVTQDVRQSIRRVQASPFIPLRDHVRGFVYDVATGTVAEVTLD